MSNKFNKYLVVTLFFITRYVYASNKSIDDIKAISGGIAFNPDDSTIYFKQDEGISSDFSNADVQTYQIQSKDIISIITSRGFLNHGKLSYKDSVYINQITGKQKEGEGINVDKPTVFYSDNDLNHNGYKADTLLTFSQGLMAFNMSFNAANENVFIVEQGFTSSNNEILPVFGIFNIRADSDANVANFIIANGGLITIENRYLFSEDNLLKNAFISKNGDIVLQSQGNIIKDTSLISNGDKFTESYAKTSDNGGSGGSITVNKEKIILNNVSTGEAFFNATNGNININTYTLNYESSLSGGSSVYSGSTGSITISTTDGTNKIAGFAKTNQNISLTTGSMTVDVTAIDDNANMFSADENITATIDKLTFKTYNDSTANLAKSVFKGNDVDVTLNSLTFGEKASFDADVYLIEATGGNAKLKIIGNDFNWKVANGIGEKLVAANGAATITIDQLDLTKMDGVSDQFNGFNFGSNVTGDIDLTIDKIYTDNNTKINGLVSRDNAHALIVQVNSDIVLDGPNTSIDSLVLSKNNGSATFNLGSNDKSIKLSGGTAINGFLVGSIGGNANLLNMTGGLNINEAKFKNDNSFLVGVEKTGTTVTLGNINADITIESLSVSDDSQKDTSLIGLSDNNGGRTANIFGKNFKLTKSKFGAIVIDEEGLIDGAGINIKPTENLEISKNEFLQSFIVAPKQSILIAGGDKKETNISGNTISKALKTEKSVTIGSSESAKTIFSNNIAKNVVDIGHSFISANGGITVLGKDIEIKDNIVNDYSGAPYGLFDASGSDIKIGDDFNTETIIISGNKAKQNFGASFMRTSNGNGIVLISKNKIDFNMQDSEDSFAKVLDVQGGGSISFKSQNINIIGNYDSKIVDPSLSNLTSFFEAGSLILGDASTTELISIYNIVLKEKNKYFFRFSKNIDINTTGTGIVKLFNLFSKDDNNIDGAIFQVDGGGYIKVKTGTLEYSDNNITKNAYLFKQDGANQTDDEISVNDIQFMSSDTKIAGFYYSKAKAFKLHGYTDSIIVKLKLLNYMVILIKILQLMELL